MKLGSSNLISVLRVVAYCLAMVGTVAPANERKLDGRFYNEWTTVFVVLVVRKIISTLLSTKDKRALGTFIGRGLWDVAGSRICLFSKPKAFCSSA